MTDQEGQTPPREPSEPVSRAEFGVAELEAQVGPSDSTLPPEASDYRDARVLEALSPGERVRVSTLHELYDERTDIRDRDVRRSRVKDLVESAAFTRTDDRVWRYRDVATDGGESEE